MFIFGVDCRPADLEFDLNTDKGRILNHARECLDPTRVGFNFMDAT
jgi:hypothetical protein